MNAAWLIASLHHDHDTAPEIPIPPPGKMPKPTFQQIESWCNSMGVSTELRFLTYPELCQLNRPCVVLLRHGPQSTGYFAVVLGTRPGLVTTINAGWLTAAVFSEDEYRLRWTGYALLPRDHQENQTTLATLLFLLGFMTPTAASLCRWSIFLRLTNRKS